MVAAAGRSEQDRVRTVLNRTATPASAAACARVDVANRLGRDLDFVIPYSRKGVLAATNTGEPYARARAALAAGFGRAIRLIEDELVRALLSDECTAPAAASWSRPRLPRTTSSSRLDDVDVRAALVGPSARARARTDPTPSA